MRAWLTIDGVKFVTDDWPEVGIRRTVFSMALRPMGTRGPGIVWWFSEGVWQGDNPAPEYLSEIERVEIEEPDADGGMRLCEEFFQRPLWGHPGKSGERTWAAVGEKMAEELDTWWREVGGFGKESFRQREGPDGGWVAVPPYFNAETAFNQKRGGTVSPPDVETRGREDTETFLDALPDLDAEMREKVKGGRDNWGGEFLELWEHARKTKKCGKRWGTWIGWGFALLLALVLWVLCAAPAETAWGAVGTIRTKIAGWVREIPAVKHGAEWALAPERQQWEEEKECLTASLAAERQNVENLTAQKGKLETDKADLENANDVLRRQLETSRGETQHANALEAERTKEMEAKQEEFDREKKTWEDHQRELQGALNAANKKNESLQAEVANWSNCFAALSQTAQDRKAALEALKKAREELRRAQTRGNPEKVMEIGEDAKQKKNWQRVMAAADVVLKWEPWIEEARALKKNAEDATGAPRIRLTATLAGDEVHATVTKGARRAGQTTPLEGRATAGTTYSFSAQYVTNGKTFAGQVTVSAKSEGVTEARIELHESVSSGARGDYSLAEWLNDALPR